MRCVPDPVSAPAYRADIDGLRGVAIAAVMLYHAHWGAPGGYVGVDVFFVISGFLIGSQLLRAIRTGELELLAFWERRARRILPALAVVLVATAIAGWLLLLPSDYEQFGASLAAQAVFASNHFFAAHSGYFANAAETRPLLHTWSLAVEEQFYLVFPLLLLGLAKLPWRTGRLIFTALCAGSFLYSVYLARHHPGAAFYFAASRAWEFGLGAILAGGEGPKLSPIWRECISASGLSAIVIAVLAYDNTTAFPGFAALLPCGGAACLIVAGASGTTFLKRLLSAPAIVLVGKISYSLYLWHWPALVFVNYFWLEGSSVAVDAITYLIVFVVALLSWKFIETPLRRRIWLAGRSACFGAAAVTTITLGALGLAIWRRHGMARRLPAAAVAYAAASADRVPEFDHPTTLAEARAGQFTVLGSSRPDAPVTFFVWGDSHAMALLPALDELGQSYGERGYAATEEGARPLLNFKSDGNGPDARELPLVGEAVVAFIRAHRIPNVVLAGHWGYWHRHVVSLSPEYLKALAETFAVLHQTGARVWVVADVPVLPWNAPRALAKMSIAGRDPNLLRAPAGPYLEQVARQRRQFLPLLTDRDHLLEPADLLVRDGTIIVTHGGAALFRDDSHLTTHGALLLKPIFRPLFER